MTNILSGQGGSSPRCYSKHQRYRGKGVSNMLAGNNTGQTITNGTINTATAKVDAGTFSIYLSKADQFAAFLQAQATRLSTSTAVIFAKLQKYTAAKISSPSTTNISQLP